LHHAPVDAGVLGDEFAHVRRDADEENGGVNGVVREFLDCGREDRAGTLREAVELIEDEEKALATERGFFARRVASPEPKWSAGMRSLSGTS
jgi:hypothetical protein